MSDKETLELAIREAIDGGWQKGRRVSNYVKPVTSINQMKRELEKGSVVQLGGHKRTLFDEIWDDYFGYEGLGEVELIFNHDFARALWGEDIVCAADGSTITLVNPHEEAWECDKNSTHGNWGGTDYEDDEHEKLMLYKYHLQQMVIHPNPIEYLREQLEGENNG